MHREYDPDAVEAQARNYWQAQGSFVAREQTEREKFYCLSMFPYPSGALHMGHVRNYSIGDAIARYQRMLGREVLQPMGWDAFGMPAENAAIERGIAPSTWTRDNIAHMRQQLQRLGFAYDWQREFATCDPDYYRWEQWLFIKLYEQGLVYRAEATVNWDPVDQTVLANEQVIDGRGWRSGALVEQRQIPQWFMRITAFADDLLDGLDSLEGWPERVRTMQRNWIGRSEGLEIRFAIAGSAQQIKVFTTRPDTLFGVTYMAVAPEHPLAQQAARGSAELAAQIDALRQRGSSEAALQDLEKIGVDLGIRALHPLTGEELPVYAANFVLMGYGEGAIMAVPGHDQRDWEFARKYGLPVVPVVAPPDYQGAPEELVATAAYTERGVLINSPGYDGLSCAEAFAALARHLQKAGSAEPRVHYRLRDWGVSRQRYWGTPIPMIHCDACGPVAVPEDQLPVELPENVVVDGAGSPLARMPEFYACSCPSCGAPARRDTDTFDTFVESSWYFARFASADCKQAMVDDRASHWLPVDHYVGGIEHAVLHLLYARFFTRAMHRLGLLPVKEPFTRLLTQGMVLKDGSKMSKSRGNTVDPQALIDRYGADTARLFTLFAAPPEQSLEWSDSGVAGASRFLRKLWNWCMQLPAAGESRAPAAVAGSESLQRVRRELHRLLSQADYDMQRLQFNTVISAAMKILNLLLDVDDTGQPGAGELLDEGRSILLRLLAPAVPHIAHVLWVNAGYEGAVIDAAWPKADPEALRTETIDLVVQVNGKLRGRITVPADATRDTVEAQALADENVRRFVQDRPVRKLILVPGKLVNIVV